MTFRRTLVIALSVLAAIPAGAAGGVCLYFVVRFFGGLGGYVEASPIVAVAAVGFMVFTRVREALTGLLLIDRRHEKESPVSSVDDE